MKRFDLQQIMRNAHRTYKYVGKKQGKTFGEVLKSTWKLAKLDVAMQEAETKRQEEAAKKAAERQINQPVEVVRYTFQGNIYNSNSRGYLGSQYCGD